MSREAILILDFGGQYNQLIARRVRECSVYCEVKPYTMSLAEIRAFDPMGIIFTGGPNSVYDEKAPHVDPAVFDLGVPVLGICYGCQLIAQTWEAASPPPRTTAPGSTERQKPSMTPAAPCLPASPRRGSPG